jgi:hypothetical protein
MSGITKAMAFSTVGLRSPKCTRPRDKSNVVVIGFGQAREFEMYVPA